MWGFCNWVIYQGGDSRVRQSHSLKTNNNVVIYGSLSEGVDLMDGIIEECRKHKITSGMVSCIGSLRKVGYVLFKAIDGTPSGYGRNINIDNPVELINCTGFICQDENNNLDLHLHGSVIEENGKISAGHFLRHVNPTLITVEFMITAGKDIGAIRTFDENLGFKVINFSK
jgi:predicted DNA-binding protein with PD1-like motif